MNITFIGGGNMAQAIIGGLLAKKIAPATLRVVDVDAAARDRVGKKYPGVRGYGAARDALRDGDVIVLAVKPQQMRDAVSSLGIAPNSHLIISIAAGITLTFLSRRLGAYKRLIRAMPNTPALIGEGVTAYYAMPGHVGENDLQEAETILRAIGKAVVVRVRDEQEGNRLLDAVTAISGSGPAYVFMFMEALEQAAAELNLPQKVAHQLVLQTFIGAARLAEQSPDSLSLLRERVTSKGGTTEAALNSMAKDRVKDAIIRAVKAANERGRELGEELDKN